jgi:hypothetical protein
MEQGLHLLVSAAMADRKQTKSALLIGQRMPPQADGRPEGAPIAEGKKGFDPTPLRPGCSGDHPQLKT